jgi:hypothetical protein
MSHIRSIQLLLAGLMVLSLLHALTYWVNCEDAFISFRYAENLAAGRGLVFNEGEYVEGYTNFLWVLVLAGARLLGADVPETARILGALLGAFTIPACYWISRCALGLSPVASLLPGAVIAASASVAAWLGGGLETPLFMSLFTVALGLLYREVTTRPRLPLAGLLFALTALTRPEAAGLFVVAMLYVAVFRLTDLRTLLLFLVGFGVLFLPHLGFRLLYYGYPLPNTYYAKTEIGFSQLPDGLLYVGEFLLRHGAWALLFLPGLWLLKDGPRGAHRALPLVVLLAAFGVVAKVGGDFYYYWRFCVPYLPWLVVLCCAGAFGVGARFLARLRPRARPEWIAGLCALSMLVPAGLWSHPQHESEFEIVREALPVLQSLGNWLGRNLPPTTTAAGSMMGLVPYYSGLRTVDMLGVVDEHIAHRDMPLEHGSVGHRRYDSDYILSRNPDVVVIEFTIDDPAFDPVTNLHTEGIYEYISLRLSLWPAPRYLLKRREFRLRYAPRSMLLPDGRHGFYFERSDRLARLEEATRNRPQDPKGFFDLGVTYRQQGLLADAVRALRKAAELNPRHLLTRLNIGFFLLEAKRPVEALQEFENLEALAPGNLRVLFGIAESLQALGRFQEAAIRWRQYLQQSPDGRYARKAREMLEAAERHGGR